MRTTPAILLCACLTTSGQTPPVPPGVAAVKAQSPKAVSLAGNDKAMAAPVQPAPVAIQTNSMSIVTVTVTNFSWVISRSTNVASGVWLDLADGLGPIPLNFSDPNAPATPGVLVAYRLTVQGDNGVYYALTNPPVSGKTNSLNSTTGQ